MSNQMASITKEVVVVHDDKTTSDQDVKMTDVGQSTLTQYEILKSQANDTTQRILPLTIRRRKQGITEQQGLYIGETITRNVLDGDIILSESPIVMYNCLTHSKIGEQLQKLSKTPVPFTLLLTYNALETFKSIKGFEEAKRTYHWNTKQVLYRDEKLIPQISVITYMAKKFNCTKEDIIAAWNTVGAYHIQLRPYHIRGYYGVALYKFSSMINHSCEPNAEWVFQPNTGTITIQAIKLIHAGKEITTSYLPAISILERHERQLYLMENDIMGDGCCTCRRCRRELMENPNTMKKYIDGPIDWKQQQNAAINSCREILHVAGVKMDKLDTIMKLADKCDNNNPVEIWHARWMQFEFLKPYFQQWPVELWPMMGSQLYSMFFMFGSVRKEDLEVKTGKSRKTSNEVMKEFANFLEEFVFPLFSDKSLEDFNQIAIERHRRSCRLKPNLLETNVEYKNFPLNRDGITISCQCGDRIDHCFVGHTNMSVTPLMCRQYSHRHFIYMMFTILCVIGDRVGKHVIEPHRTNGWFQSLNMIADDRTRTAYMQSNCNLCTFTDVHPSGTLEIQK